MSDELDPDPGEKGGAAGAAATTLTSEAVNELIEKAVTGVKAEADERYGALEKKFNDASENHRQQVARLKKRAGGEDGGEGGGGAVSPELREELDTANQRAEALQKQLDDMQAGQAQAEINSELHREVGKLSGLADGSGTLILDLVLPYAKRNSQGKTVYARPGEAQVPIVEKLAELAALPSFKAAANRGGGGVAESATGAARTDVKTIPNTPAAIEKHAKELREGTAVLDLGGVGLPTG